MLPVRVLCKFTKACPIWLGSQAQSSLPQRAVALGLTVLNTMQTAMLLQHIADTRLLSWAMIVSGAATLVAELTGIAAPYGRYEGGAGKWWGVRLNAKLAWLVSCRGQGVGPGNRSTCAPGPSGQLQWC